MSKRILPTASSSDSHSNLNVRINEGDCVFKCFLEFEHTVKEKEELRKKLRQYFDFNGETTSKACFAEIYNTANTHGHSGDILIKTETSTERLVYANVNTNVNVNVNSYANVSDANTSETNATTCTDTCVWSNEDSNSNCNSNSNNTNNNITGVVNHTTKYSIPNKFSKTVKPNAFSRTLYEYALSSIKNSCFIELKLNRDEYASDEFKSYILNKVDAHNGLLVPDPPQLGPHYYFYHNEIDIEFNSLNNYLFHHLGHFLTMMSYKGKFSFNSRLNMTVLLDLIKSVDNCHLLSVLDYIMEMFHYRIKLGDWSVFSIRHVLNGNPYNRCASANANANPNINTRSNRMMMPNMTPYYPTAAINPNTNPNVNTIVSTNSSTKEINNEKIMKEIRNELITKEQQLTKMIQDNPNHYSKYTHIYINDHTMTEADIKYISTWLIHYSKAKLFAWHLNQEDTLRLGLKVKKVSTVPKLNDLNIYLKLL